MQHFSIHVQKLQIIIHATFFNSCSIYAFYFIYIQNSLWEICNIFLHVFKKWFMFKLTYIHVCNIFLFILKKKKNDVQNFQIYICNVFLFSFKTYKYICYIFYIFIYIYLKKQIIMCIYIFQDFSGFYFQH